jgi:hypothetical protein
MGNKNWTAVIDVAGVKERGVGGGYVEPTTGAYKVRITGTEEYEKDGTKSVQVQTVIVGGDFDGVETRIYLGLDLSKAGNQRSWRGALASIGIDPSELDKGAVTIGADTFDGAEAFIYYKQKDVDDPKSQSQRNFITPAQYANLTAEAAPTAPATRPVGASAAKPAAASVPSMTVPQPTGAAARLRGMAATRQQ